MPRGLGREGRGQAKRGGERWGDDGGRRCCVRREARRWPSRRTWVSGKKSAAVRRSCRPSFGPERLGRRASGPRSDAPRPHPRPQAWHEGGPSRARPRRLRPWGFGGSWDAGPEGRVGGNLLQRPPAAEGDGEGRRAGHVLGWWAWRAVGQGLGDCGQGRRGVLGCRTFRWKLGSFGNRYSSLGAS